jgi:hypothetical protein
VGRTTGQGLGVHQGSESKELLRALFPWAAVVSNGTTIAFRSAIRCGVGGPATGCLGRPGQSRRRCAPCGQSSAPGGRMRSALRLRRAFSFPQWSSSRAAALAPPPIYRSPNSRISRTQPARPQRSQRMRRMRSSIWACRPWRSSRSRTSSRAEWPHRQVAVIDPTGRTPSPTQAASNGTTCLPMILFCSPIWTACGRPRLPSTRRHGTSAPEPTSSRGRDAAGGLRFVRPSPASGMIARSGLDGRSRATPAEFLRSRRDGVRKRLR